MFDRYFDEINIGDQGVSRARTVTETDIVNFCALSGDWYPVHSNVEFAKNTAFGERIAHGLLVLAIASGLVPTVPGPVVAFYGMDRVRFVAPVKIGDTIHVETHITGKEDKGETGVVTFDFIVKNQRDEAVVLAVYKALLNKRG